MQSNITVVLDPQKDPVILIRDMNERGFILLRYFDTYQIATGKIDSQKISHLETLPGVIKVEMSGEYFPAKDIQIEQPLISLTRSIV